MVHALAVPQTEDPGLCSLVATARGDGCLAIYDADVRPPAPAASGSSGSRRSGGGKARQRRGCGAAAEAAPGRLCLLGREMGGHTAAVNCVSFLHGSGWHHVLTGGNDARLLLWNWRRGADGEEAAAAAAQAAAAVVNVGGKGAAVGSAVAAAEEEETYQESQVLAAEVRHGHKVNWACSFEQVGGANVAVADTSCRLSLLALR